MHVGERQRRDEKRADERSRRAHVERAQSAIDGERQRDAYLPPRRIHQHVVPAAERDAAPYLQQRHRRRVLGRRIEIDGAVGGEPLVDTREGRDVAELEPDARLRRPLRPCVPRIEGPRCRLRCPAARNGRRAMRSAASMRSARRRASSGETTRVRNASPPARGSAPPPRRQTMIAHITVARGDRQRDRREAELDPCRREHAHPQRQQERAGQVAGAGQPCDFAGRGEVARRRLRRREHRDAQKPREQDREQPPKATSIYSTRNSAAPGSTSTASADTGSLPSKRSFLSSALYWAPRRW